VLKLFVAGPESRRGDRRVRPARLCALFVPSSDESMLSSLDKLLGGVGVKIRATSESKPSRAPSPTSMFEVAENELIYPDDIFGDHSWGALPVFGADQSELVLCACEPDVVFRPLSELSTLYTHMKEYEIIQDLREYLLSALCANSKNGDMPTERSMNEPTNSPQTILGVHRLGRMISSRMLPHASAKLSSML
jgi:hypothetical protein